MKPRTIALTAIPLLALVVAGGASIAQQNYDSRDPQARSSELRQAAHRLAADSAQLHRTLRRIEGRSNLTQGARTLARHAAELRQRTERVRDWRGVRETLDDLHRAYHETRQQMFDANRDRDLSRVAAHWSRVASDYEMLALSARVPGNALCELDTREAREYRR
jgi:hypothetical protein